MPYQLRKPFITVNGQRVVNPAAVPQRVPVCDRCDEYAATVASVYTELAPDKWWKWFSYPRYTCKPEAFMGCDRHPVASEIRFLDGHVEPFIRTPLKRWQRLKEWDALIVAGVLAVLAAVGVAAVEHII